MLSRKKVNEIEKSAREDTDHKLPIPFDKRSHYRGAYPIFVHRAYRAKVILSTESRLPIILP